MRMSNTTNTNLIEEAKELAEYWTGTMHEAILTNLIKSNDLDGLREAVVKARQDAYDSEEEHEEGAYYMEAQYVRAEEIGDALREDGPF